MKTFYISVTETLNKVVAVEAECLKDAFELAEGAANSGEIDLTADDFVDRDFSDETEETRGLIEEGIVKENRFQKIK